MPVRQHRQRPARRPAGRRDPTVSGNCQPAVGHRADPVLRGPAGPADRRAWPSSWPSRGSSPRPAARRSSGPAASRRSSARRPASPAPACMLEPFGTELEVLPIVYGNGQIWLEINPRITRGRTRALGSQSAARSAPASTSRPVRTAVMLESGQTFAIGGLIQNSVQAVVDQGAGPRRPAVRRDRRSAASSTSRRESELVILVTPRLVDPMDCDQVPKRLAGRETRTPDDYELFLENILEAPRASGRCGTAGATTRRGSATRRRRSSRASATSAPAGTAGAAAGRRPAGAPPPVPVGPVPAVPPAAVPRGAAEHERCRCPRR